MFCVFSGAWVAQLRAYLNQPEVRRGLIMSMPTPPWGAADGVPDQPVAVDAIDLDEEDLDDETMTYQNEYAGQVMETVEQDGSTAVDVVATYPVVSTPYPVAQGAPDVGGPSSAHQLTGMLNAAMLTDEALVDGQMSDDRDDWRRSQAPGPWS